jgi:hypothetical protein
MEQKSINLLVFAFLTLILGLALIQPVSTDVLARTTKLNVLDENTSVATAVIDANNINESINITLTNVPTSWKILDCPLSNYAITNSTGSALVETTDYLFYPAEGKFSLVNSTDVLAGVTGNNLTYVDYDYCGNDYLNSAFGRSTLKIVPGFFALAILGVSLFLFYSVAKNEGIFLN